MTFDIGYSKDIQNTDIGYSSLKNMQYYTSPVDENVALNPALFVTGSAMNRRVMYLPVDM